jgi:fructokinase
VSSTHAEGEVPASALGIDLGGTKIEGVIIDGEGRVLASRRVATPRGDCEATIRAIGDLASALEVDLAGGVPAKHPLGIGIPGSISPATGCVQNANSTWLNGRRFAADLQSALGRQVRLANDANCFVLSEATDGNAAGAASVFGVILGTGCGGGIVRFGELVDGPRGIGGEWGHNALPWPSPEEFPGPECWCGRRGCMEAWVSGPALTADHLLHTGAQLDAGTIAEQASAGDQMAQATLDRHASRLARGIAHVVNILDPEVIILGGGLSRLEHLYRVLPDLMAPHIFADAPFVSISPPKWGDASGVRGAARLWPIIGPIT